jgi:molybdate transport system substrate-binding protein
MIQPVLAAPGLRVAVAANFKPTLAEICREFTANTGHQVTLSSASTGVLSNQVLHGAPFDLLFAADRESPDKLFHAGIGQQPFCYAIGQLVLVGQHGDLDKLAQPGLSLAIANPATAPYGRAAMEVLQREAFIDARERKLVRGNNAVQAYQFWHSGAVALALVPRSLAPEATTIPQAWHQPLRQHAMVLKESAAASALLQWLQRAEVREQITGAGYLPCP